MNDREKKLSLAVGLLTVLPGMGIYLFNPYRPRTIGGAIVGFVLNGSIAALLVYTALNYNRDDFKRSDFKINLPATILVMVLYGGSGWLIVNGIAGGFWRFAALAAMWTLTGVLGYFLIPLFWAKWNPEILASYPEADSEEALAEAEEENTAARWSQTEFPFYCVPVLSAATDYGGNTIRETKTYNMSGVTRHTLILPTWKKFFQLHWLAALMMGAVASFVFDGFLAIFFNQEYPYFLIWNVPPRGDTLVLFILQALVIVVMFAGVFAAMYDEVVKSEMRRHIRRLGYYRHNKDFDVVPAPQWNAFRKKLQKVN